MKITFWKDNLLSQEQSISVSQILSDFHNTESVAKKNYDSGWPFERSILLFMSDLYGSFDRLTDIQWEEIGLEHNTYLD